LHYAISVIALFKLELGGHAIVLVPVLLQGVVEAPGLALVNGRPPGASGGSRVGPLGDALTAQLELEALDGRVAARLAIPHAVVPAHVLVDAEVAHLASLSAGEHLIASLSEACVRAVLGALSHALVEEAGSIDFSQDYQKGCDER